MLRKLAIDVEVVSTTFIEIGFDLLPEIGTAMMCNDPAKPAHLKQLKQTPQLVSSCPTPDAAGGGYRSQSSHQ